MSNNIDLWPSITFLFCAFNLSSWYFKGEVLFSWWWLLPVVILHIVIVAGVLGIAKAIMD